MQPDSLRELARCHLALRSLNIVMSESWASSVDGYRTRIRENLMNLIEGDASILDLEVLPRSETHEISISHNRGLGGYATTGKGTRIGFDLELTERALAARMHRACVRDEERSEAPGDDYLWTAKEAAFKALPPALQPSSLRALELGNWKEIATEVHSCELLRLGSVNSPIRIKGLTGRWRNQTLALFVEDRSEKKVETCVGC